MSCNSMQQASIGYHPPKYRFVTHQLLMQIRLGKPISKSDFINLLTIIKYIKITTIISYYYYYYNYNLILLLLYAYLLWV